MGTSRIEGVELVRRGRAPLYLAGRMLNRSLADLVLFPALANVGEPDPRRRAVIPAFSGRGRGAFSGAGRSAAVDPAALLTLGYLGLLQELIDGFESVYLPHSTLTWLFEEKLKAIFHQPSRLREARRLRDLLHEGRLRKLAPTAVPGDELSSQVGAELAVLIAEAEAAASATGSQHLVVRPAPAYQPHSFMEEEADLADHASVLSSCQAVVGALASKGLLTRRETEEAQAYFESHERQWPDQPNIADGASTVLGQPLPRLPWSSRIAG